MASGYLPSCVPTSIPQIVTMTLICRNYFGIILYVGCSQHSRRSREVTPMTAPPVPVSPLQQPTARAIAAGRHDCARLELAATLVVLGAVEQIDASTYRV